MIYVVATLKAKPGKHADLIAGAKPCIAATLRETGCISYDLTQSITDPDTFVFVERWTTREALEAHFKTPHLATWREVGKTCVGERSVEIVHVAQVETL
jgi:quinol monooxygenase YgiN